MERVTSSVTDRTKLRQLAHLVTRLLHDEYGSPRHGNPVDPLDDLVYITLSQMTTGPSFARVFERLQARVGTWDHLASLPVGRIRHLIREGGLSNQKAPRLKAAVARVRQDFGRRGLAALRLASDRETLTYLTSLPGVGVKTAKCVMMYALGRRVLPVDTHVRRVGQRLGLAPPGLPHHDTDLVLEQAIPPADRYAFHVNALAHGRMVCRPLRPRCGQCCLADLCPTARSGLLQRAPVGGRRGQRVRAG